MDNESQRLMNLVASTKCDISPSELFINIRKIRNLVKDGADVNYVSPDDESTPLSHAIYNGVEPMIKLLASLGCDLNQAIRGYHPLVFSSQHNSSILVTLSELGSGSGLPENSVIETLSDLGSQVNNEVLMKIKSNIKTTESDNASAHQKEHLLYDYAKLRPELEREKNDARRHYLKLLAEKGCYRTYSKTPSISAIDELYGRFPNFHHVIDHVRRHIALANLSHKSIMMVSPILLHGAAGIGKTRFVKELAKALEMEFSKISCGSVTAGWIISGSSTSWQEGRPGLVHVALRDGKTGNPLIMLDEIDKLSGDPRFNAFGSLFDLLEESTASEFTDEAVGIKTDCSKVTWIATANDISVIPSAILSRMKLIEIDLPNQTQMRETIRSIMHDIVNDNAESWGARFSEEVSEDVFALLRSYAPRDIKLMIIDAMGEAAGSRHEETYKLIPDDFFGNKRSRSKTFGFV